MGSMPVELFDGPSKTVGDGVCTIVGECEVDGAGVGCADGSQIGILTTVEPTHSEHFMGISDDTSIVVIAVPINDPGSI